MDFLQVLGLDGLHFSMKKNILFLLFLFLFISSAFAVKSSAVRPIDKRVCVLPSNTEIEHYLSLFIPPEKIVKGDVERIRQVNANFDVEMLSSGDLRLMEFVSATNSADIYVIPLVRSASGFNHLTLYVYDGGTIEKVYEAIDYQDSTFKVDIVLDLYKYFTETRYSLLKFEDLVPGTSIYLDGRIPRSVEGAVLVPEGEHRIRLSSLGYVDWQDDVSYEPDTVNTIRITLDKPVYSALTITSPQDAEVFIDGVKVGNTPYVVENYSVPFIFRLHADGYTDRVVSVSNPTDHVNVNLVTIEMGEVDEFKKMQNRFYWSFTRTLLLFGGMAATRAVSGFNTSTQNAVNYGFYGAIAASAIEMGYRLYKYYNGVKNIAP